MISADALDARGEVRLDGMLQLGGRCLAGPLALALQPAGWTALLGRSGGGKSTLLRLLAGLPSPASLSGTVSNRAPVALMAQDPALPRWLPVAKQVILPARLRGDRIDHRAVAEVLDRTGLAALSGRYPHELSGGQRQRVALARVLLEDRALVLLDEPFSALDAAARHEMQALAHDCLSGRTVLIVTHDPVEAARLAERIYLLQDGTLTRHPVPGGPAPRDLAAPQVQACHAGLLAALMRQEGHA